MGCVCGGGLFILVENGKGMGFYDWLEEGLNYRVKVKYSDSSSRSGSMADASYLSLFTNLFIF